jgi:hypothetical protein
MAETPETAFGTINQALASMINPPPLLCEVSPEGAVKWTADANPKSIMDMGKFGDSAHALALLALWYATGGKDVPTEQH